MNDGGGRHEAAEGVAPNDSASLDDGRRLFHTYCWFCHGTGGRGDGPVARLGEAQAASALSMAVERSEVLRIERDGATEEIGLDHGFIWLQM